LRAAVTIVVGAGYVGRRVLTNTDQPGSIALGRSTGLDLDTAAKLPLTLPDAYRVLYTVPPSPAHSDDLRLARLLAWLAPKPARFVYISTTGVYGDCGGALVDESAALRPASDRARRRVAAEALLRSWAAEHAVPCYVLRTPAIYGPGRLGLERIHERLPLIAAKDAYPGNRIHVADLVRCCLAALCGDAPPGIYNVGDGDYRSPTWFSQEVARQAGLAALPEIARSTAGECRRVVTERMREKLGVTPEYANAAEGIRASLTEE
jgi:nucleoside-diphosphate-sugar epimerase